MLSFFNTIFSKEQLLAQLMKLFKVFKGSTGKIPVLPEEIAYLMDSIFEGLPNKEAKNFPIQVIEAIPEGADLSLVWPKFAVWLLTDPVHGVIRFNDDPSVTAVADLYERVIQGNQPTQKEWTDAAADARAAAAATDAAAWAAAAADARAAARAAWAAADAAAWAAWAAADAAEAARDADWAATTAAARAVQAKKLIELLSGAEVKRDA